MALWARVVNSLLPNERKADLRLRLARELGFCVRDLGLGWAKVSYGSSAAVGGGPVDVGFRASH